LNSDALFSLGRATEITRDELKFARFIVRLRLRFSMLFLKLLEKQLILKGIVTPEDWDLISGDIRFDYAKDNYFAELKEAEILEGRINLARNFQDMAGKYYSHEWVRKNILQQSDDDIQRNDEEITEENNSGDVRWLNPAIEQNAQYVQQQQQSQGDGSQQADPEMNDKMEQVRQAMIFVDQMKQKGKANRSMADESKYKQAVQLIAKNPDIVAQMGTGQQ
jgi:hypothetical protein